LTSLYRKWRSQSFDDLVGQEHVTRTLRNAVREGRVAHAYLFTGPRGTGKTSTARILARAVNCLNPQDGNPDNTCDRCVAAHEGRALDVIEIDAASNTSVENVRDLRERVAYATSEADFKVYIVDEVHRLSGAAFDAFLKTLEEPPPHVIFVFASTEPHKVPSTIASRCQRFDFRRISVKVTRERLDFIASQENLSVSEGALELIALSAAGSLRDALVLLEQVTAFTQARVETEDVRRTLGLADPGLITRLTDHMLENKAGEALGECQIFAERGGDPRGLLEQLVAYWRALMLSASGAPRSAIEIDPALSEALDRQAAGLDPKLTVAVIEALVGQEFSPKFNMPASLPLEVGIVAATLELHSSDAAMSVLQPDPPPPAGSESAVPATPPSPSKQWLHAPATSTPAVPEPPDKAPPRENGAASSLSGGIPEASTAPRESEDPSRDESETHAKTENAQPREAPASLPAANELEVVWTNIVTAMRAKSPSLQAVLRSGYLMSAEGDTLTIAFLQKDKFHQGQLADNKKRRLVEEVALEVTGSAYNVNIVVVTREELAALHGDASLAEDDGFIEEAAERVRQFHIDRMSGGTP
jgi:DNA polymerase-3 subunit gamma/tau